MVFHKNKLLCLIQRLLLSFNPLRRFFIKNDIRILINRIFRIVPDIRRFIRRHPVRLLQLYPNRFVLNQQPVQTLINPLKPLPYQPRRFFASKQQIHAEAQHRKRQNQDNPGHFKRCICPAAIKQDHDNQRKYAGRNRNPCRISV